MAKQIRVPNVVMSYPVVLETIIEEGHDVSPRGHDTIELTGLRIISNDPTTHMIPEGEKADFLESEIDTIRRGVEPDVTASDELIERLDLEEDGTFYEDLIRERISTLWPQWVDKLNEEPDTRKIIATFGDGIDSPCTTVLQFLLRDGELHCFTYNRSQDMMFAYPMDVALFERLQCQLADEIGSDVGRYEHTMGSAHIYKEQLDEAKELITG